MEDVRAAPLGERRPLLDAEPMLLVDHRDGEVGELHLALDERMRADGDPDVTRRDELVRGAALPRRQARREERDADAELGAEALDREEVLLGEGLRRGHERALAAGLDRPQQAVEGDRGLAGAHVSLQQPLHRGGAREVGVDLLHRPLLRSRQRERQHVAVPGRELRGRRKRLGDERLALRGPPAKGELEREELVERQPAPGALGIVLAAGPVDADERIGPERQGVVGADRRGQRLAGVPRARQRRLGQRAKRLLRQIRSRGIDRREVGGLHRVAEVERRHLEPEPVRLPAHADVRSRDELRLEPRLVEPRGADLARVVGDVRCEDVEPAAASGRGAADDDVQHGLVLPEERCDRPFLRGGLVPPRPVREQVRDGRDPEPSELPAQSGADAR